MTETSPTGRVESEDPRPAPEVNASEEAVAGAVEVGTESPSSPEAVPATPEVDTAALAAELKKQQEETMKGHVVQAIEASEERGDTSKKTIKESNKASEVKIQISPTVAIAKAKTVWGKTKGFLSAPWMRNTAKFIGKGLFGLFALGYEFVKDVFVETSPKKDKK